METGLPPKDKGEDLLLSHPVGLYKVNRGDFVQVIPGGKELMNCLDSSPRNSKLIISLGIT